jgi:hypothetical protein
VASLPRSVALLQERSGLILLAAAMILAADGGCHRWRRLQRETLTRSKEKLFHATQYIQFQYTPDGFSVGEFSPRDDDRVGHVSRGFSCLPRWRPATARRKANSSACFSTRRRSQSLMSLRPRLESFLGRCGQLRGPRYSPSLGTNCCVDEAFRNVDKAPTVMYSVFEVMRDWLGSVQTS